MPIQAGPDGRFSQEDLNTALANDRRKHQAKLEKTIQDMQANANLTAAEHEALAERLEEVQKEGRTKEANLAHERKQLEDSYEKKLKDEKRQREQWEKRYREGDHGARLA